MSYFYNRKNGPLVITLADNRPHTFSPRAETFVDSSLESSPMLLRYVKKGFLQKKLNLVFSQETDITEAIVKIDELEMQNALPVENEVITMGELDAVETEQTLEEPSMTEELIVNKRSKKIKE